MKKTILSFLSLLMAGSTLMAQHQMLINMKNGSVQTYNVADVNSVTWIVNAQQEAVDLGLSVKWATCNVGATAPEEYGDYFAWGETTAKTTYNWGTYFDTTDGGSTFVKYYNNGGKTVLESADDAATANWGGAWRMPTQTEITELQTKCTWTWTTQNGVNGYLVTGKNGNSIFLPAAGHRKDSRLGSAGSNGYYWFNMLSPDESKCPFCLGINSSEFEWIYYFRYYGLSVRPVYSPIKVGQIVYGSSITRSERKNPQLIVNNWSTATVSDWDGIGQMTITTAQPQYSIQFVLIPTTGYTGKKAGILNELLNSYEAFDSDSWATCYPVAGTETITINSTEYSVYSLYYGEGNTGAEVIVGIQ